MTSEVLAGVETPHVLVAADTTIASSTIAAALRGAGYEVAACPYDEVVSHLRTRKSIELLVLDGTATPWVASALLEAVRATEWTLPILLVAGRNPDLRAEAERLGVEAVIDAPLELSELLRAADRIAPAGNSLAGRTVERASRLAGVTGLPTEAQAR
jgi:CheY-like chemotaxis protein